MNQVWLNFKCCNPVNSIDPHLQLMRNKSSHSYVVGNGNLIIGNDIFLTVKSASTSQDLARAVHPILIRNTKEVTRSISRKKGRRINWTYILHYSLSLETTGPIHGHFSPEALEVYWHLLSEGKQNDRVVCLDLTHRIMRLFHAAPPTYRLRILFITNSFLQYSKAHERYGTTSQHCVLDVGNSV